MVNCVDCGYVQNPEEAKFVKEKCFRNGCGYYDKLDNMIKLQACNYDENDKNSPYINYCPSCIMRLAVMYVKYVIFKRE